MSAFGIEISENCVRLLNGKISSSEALDQLVEAVSSTGAVTDSDALRRAVHAREKEMSTGIGSGVAVPHVRIAAVTTPVLGIGLAPQGVDFNAVDGTPVKVIILFAMPPDTNKLYLGLLAQVMVALKNTNFFDRLVNSCSSKEAVALLNSTGA